MDLRSISSGSTVDLDSTPATPEDSAPLPAAVTSAPEPWTPLARLGFRIAFLYLVCFLFLYGNGNLLRLIPVAGIWINYKLDWPFRHLAEWTGQHLFHLTGLAAHWHPTGSGDTIMHWMQNGLFLVFALGGGLLWTALAALRGNTRTEYRTLHAWLRFLLRLTVAMFMITYGLAKLFPLQMQPLSIAILNEPVGHISPMTFLWGLIGLNPVYESICGAAEVLGAVLLLIRPTALAGSLLSAFVMTNVLLYNLCYDVPVKLFAANLLLAALFLALPDVPALLRFFVLHRPATPAALWVPPATRRSARIRIMVTEIVIAAALLIQQPIQMNTYWHQRQAELRTPSPLLGAWHLDANHPASGAFIDPESHSITDLYVDPSGSNFTRSTDTALWRTGIDLDPKKHTVTIRCLIGTPVTYLWQMPDADHLILTATPPTPPNAKPNAQPNDKPGAKGGEAAKPTPPFIPAVLTLTRTPLPSHYPLLERGFHFVNEWGLER